MTTTTPVFVAWLARNDNGLRPVIRELRKGVINTDGTEHVFYMDALGNVTSVYHSFETVFDTRREACLFLAAEVRKEIELLKVEADQLEVAL
jgi:hypothetical protein